MIKFMRTSNFVDVLKSSIPIIIGLQLSNALPVINLILIRSFGVEVVGGLGLASSGNLIFAALLTGVGAVLQISVAQSLISEKVNARLILGTSLFWIFGLSLLVAVVGLYTLPNLAAFVTGNDEVQLHFIAFLRVWLSIGFVPFSLSQILRYYYLGKKRNHMVLSIIAISIISNIALNWLFLHGYGGIAYVGIKGLALGRSISRIIELCLFLFILLREEGNRWFLFDYKVMFNQLKYSSTTSLKFISEAIFVMVVYVLIDRLQDVSLASHHILMRIWMVIYTLLTGVAISSQSFIGEALKQKRLAEARRWRLSTFNVIFVFSVLVLVFLNVYRFEIIAWFTIEPEVIQKVTGIIIPLSLSIIFQTYSISSSYYLIALKQNRTDFLVSLIINWCIFLPIAFLGITYSKTLEWVWSIVAIFECVRSGIYFIINRKNRPIKV